LALALIGGGLLLLVAVGAVLAYFCFAGGKDEETPPKKEEPVAALPAREAPRPSAGVAVNEPARAGQAPAPEPLVALPAEEQKKVNQAIDRGVAFLKSSQNPTGRWGAGAGHAVGYAALPGLTLLECGVGAADPAVQKAATFVRGRCPKLTATYDLALAILFLDRLGDPKDRELIRTLALRLVAGQLPSGGWVYQCPVLSDQDHRNLYTLLVELQPRLPQYGVRSAGLPSTAKGLRPGEKPNPEDKLQTADPPRAGGVVKEPGAGAKPAAAKAARAKAALPAKLNQLPVLQELPAGQLPRDSSDNSNTQFAMLGLWAAQRHGVPLDRTLARVDRRFRTSQAASGAWGYHYPSGGERPSMTCAGLLGLAIGHGAADAGAPQPGGPRKPSAQDPLIQKGLKLLGTHVGKPLGKGQKVKNRVRPGLINLYFLWSLERVGVLYNLKTVGGKDWYAWGVEMLLEHQKNEGNWQDGGYAGASITTDTCFALLFLKRANLAKDLTAKIKVLLDVTDPDQVSRGANQNR
jgi:hypothetical protein